MLILVSGATKTKDRIGAHPNLGSLISPQDGNVPTPGIPWAADNAAFSNWDERKFINMCARCVTHLETPLFVTSPDVVGDARATSLLFKRWQPWLRMLGLPVALVLQNGQESIGWATHPDNFDAVFIGGDDEFKLGRYARYCVSKAKAKGKWVHMGRVNSLKRMRYAHNIGCDSIDGSGFSMFPDVKIPKFLKWLELIERGLL